MLCRVIECFSTCVRRLQWAPGQPDNAFGGEDCGDLRAMNNFTGLNDLKCANMLQWICEKTLSSK